MSDRAERQAAVDRWHAKQPPKLYLLTWGGGTQSHAFRDETEAIKYAVILATVYGTKDAQLTGPDHEYETCDDECGRLFREGDGRRLSAKRVVCDACYAGNSAVVGDTMAAIRADERQDTYMRVRR